MSSHGWVVPERFLEREEPSVLSEGSSTWMVSTQRSRSIVTRNWLPGKWRGSR